MTDVRSTSRVSQRKINRLKVRGCRYQLLFQDDIVGCQCVRKQTANDDPLAETVQGRDAPETFLAETETRPETLILEPETRPRRPQISPRSDQDRHSYHLR